MKTISLVIAATALLTLNACNTDNRQNNENANTEVNTRKDTPAKMIEYLVGDWRSLDGASGGETKDGPGDEITFTSEARYIAYRGNEKVDSGAYRMNEQLNNLYLESEVNESPREFELDLKSDTLTLSPKSDSGQGGRQYTYRRAGPAPARPDRSSEGDETEQTERQ